jgi:hypothetical protein
MYPNYCGKICLIERTCVVITQLAVILYHSETVFSIQQ